MGLLYHRPIRYIVLHSFKFFLNVFIFDVCCFCGDEEIEVLNWRWAGVGNVNVCSCVEVLKRTKTSLQDLHTATHIYWNM
jgi:hypothetical protein